MKTLDESIKQIAEEIKGKEAETLSSELVRLGAKKLIEQLLEAEVCERLGRSSYERRAAASRGYRNGYKRRNFDTGEGRIKIELPQVRDLETTYQSKLWQAMGNRTELLEQLVIEMYARGLSTRDIEDTLKELGSEGLLSKSSVSRVTEQLWEQYQEFSTRDLSGYDIVYLFADAVYESLRQQAGVKQAVLVSWAMLSDGSKVLIHMGLGNKESYDDWLDHFRDLTRRGLISPITVTTDGAPGLIKAVEAMWPEAERIRCWAHKMRNVLEKAPEEVKAQVRAWLELVREAPDYQTGKQIAELVIAYLSDYPSALASFEQDLEASLSHLKLPAIHRKHIRTTNLIERSFLEERRRAKVIPRFRCEKECLKLVFATLWRASERWRKVSFTEHEQRVINRFIEQRNALRRTAPVKTIA